MSSQVSGLHSIYNNLNEKILKIPFSRYQGQNLVTSLATAVRGQSGGGGQNGQDAVDPLLKKLTTPTSSSSSSSTSSSSTSSASSSDLNANLLIKCNSNKKAASSLIGGALSSDCLNTPKFKSSLQQQQQQLGLSTITAASKDHRKSASSSVQAAKLDGGSSSSPPLSSSSPNNSGSSIVVAANGASLDLESYRILVLETKHFCNQLTQYDIECKPVAHMPPDISQQIIEICQMATTLSSSSAQSMSQVNHIKPNNKTYYKGYIVYIIWF